MTPPIAANKTWGKRKLDYLGPDRKKASYFRKLAGARAERLYA